MGSMKMLIGTGAGMGAAGYTLAPVFSLLDQLVPPTIFNVPFSWWAAGVVGAVMSLFFGQVPPTRRRFYGEPLAATCFGISGAVVAANWLDLEWVAENGPMTCLMACGMARWFLSPAIERGVRFISESNISIPFLKKKGE